MDAYPRLNLENPKETQYWIGNANEFWRRADRDKRQNLSQAVRDTLEDVARYCAAFPDDPKLHMVLPSSLIQYTSDRSSDLLNVVAGIDAIVRTGAAPNSVGMLSNWVSLLNYSFEPLEGASCAWSLRETVGWLTQQEKVHSWDSAIVFMAAKMTQQYSTRQDSEALSNSCAMDSNVDRMTMRLMTVMEHTAVGDLWWKAIKKTHNGSPDTPMPEMPIARDVITRSERADQAWWRYGHEMEKTPQYAWVRAWVGALTSPASNETFSTNGLL